MDRQRLVERPQAVIFRCRDCRGEFRTWGLIGAAVQAARLLGWRRAFDGNWRCPVCQRER
jgi:hypothetical protein